MKTIGIIGGLGPETTAKFYLEIISSCLKLNPLQRVPIFIGSVPMWLKPEEDLITGKKIDENILPLLIDTARRLESAGADFLVMPCNTMHIFIKEISDSVNIPVICIVDETIDHLETLGISHIGFLATSATINQDLFETKLKHKGINVIPPSKKQQKVIDRIIFRLVLGQRSTKDQEMIDEVINDLRSKGAQKIILACTDLQLIINSRNGDIIDTMQILARSTISNAV